MNKAYITEHPEGGIFCYLWHEDQLVEYYQATTPFTFYGGIVRKKIDEQLYVVEYQPQTFGVLTKPHTASIGQTLWVYLKQEPQYLLDDHSLPKLGYHISLTSPHFIYQPLEKPHILYSSKLTPSQKQDLQKLSLQLNTGLWIIRQKAPFAPHKDLTQEVEQLILWGQPFHQAPTPFSTYAPLSSLQGWVNHFFSEIDHLYYTHLKHKTMAPSYLATSHVKTIPEASVIDDIHENHIPLTKGGSLWFYDKAAVKVIDINKGNNPLPIPAFNKLALSHIYPLLRLKKWGGLIVIDCLKQKDYHHLNQALKQYTRHDTTSTQCLPISRFGLAELMREYPKY